jgi:hypothetical protein
LPAKHQKFKISIDPKYSDEAKESIAQDVIDFIVKRTKQRKDKFGEPMAGYSKAYAKSVTGQAAGKKTGQAANLNLSGDMLFALGEYKKIGKSYIELGYEKGSEENGKADGNIRGTYGSDTPNPSKARDFLGINDKELQTILSNYPIEDEEKIEESISINKFAEAKAKEIAEKTSKKLEKNIAALVEKYGYGDGKK